MGFIKWLLFFRAYLSYITRYFCNNIKAGNLIIVSQSIVFKRFDQKGKNLYINARTKINS